MDMNVVMYPEITGSLQIQTINQYPNRYDANAIGTNCHNELCDDESYSQYTASRFIRLREFKLELSGNMNRYV